MEKLDRVARPPDPPPVVDLRSDVLSPATPEMFEAMARAEIGWTLKGEDPSVARLERHGAALLGTEAALFVPNASTANLLALHVQLGRGSAVLLDRLAHVNVVEWYALALGGLLTRTVTSDRGRPDPAEVEAALADAVGGRAPRVGMLVLENTHTFAGGVAITAGEMAGLADLAHRHGAMVHLDGARLWNAAVALGVPAASLVAPVDTVSVSLNKGLCAPYGGLLAGRAQLVAQARELANMMGFGRIHKAGHLAAAAIVALETMTDRLAEDHRRTRLLAEALAGIEGLEVDLATVQTNIVLARPADARFGDPEVLVDDLRRRGLALMTSPGGYLRAVLHRGIGDDDVEAAIAILRAALG